MPLFDDLETAVIADIARRVRKTMTYTRTAELMAMDMRKLGYSPNKIRTEVAKLLRESPEYIKAVEQNTIDYKKEVKDIIADIVAKAKEEGNDIVANSGDMAWIDDMRVWESNGVPITDDSFLPMLVRGIQKQVGDEILNLSKTTGFKGLYGFESIENMYRRELNSAVMQISSGTFSADAVVRKVIHELAQSGLRSIDYGSGRSLQLDSAVKLAVRTGCAQLSAKITDENIQRTEQNLVQVSSHWGARNKGVGIMNHEEWQGKVYYIKNEHDLTEEAQRIGQTSIDDLWEKTGYSVDGEHENNPLGLYGYNCRHRLYPFFEGVSEPIKFPQEPTPKEVDGKTYDYYAQTQRMRLLERRVRALKREKEALKLYGADKEELYRMDQKISNATDEYKEFCKAVGMKPSAPNLRYEVGSADLHKTKAYKDYEAITQNSYLPNIKGKESPLKIKSAKEIRKVAQSHIETVQDNHLREELSDMFGETEIKVSRIKTCFKGSNTMELSEKFTKRQLFHELFHGMDIKYKISETSYLEDELIKDYNSLTIQSMINGKGIEEMLYSKHPHMFESVSEGRYRVKAEFAPISDIFHGLSHGKVFLGYGHFEKFRGKNYTDDATYWDEDVLRLQRETFADFGEMHSMENEEFERIMEDIFKHSYSKFRLLF